MILIGSKVFGANGLEYTVEKSIGGGGFGQVFLVSNGAATLALKSANADGMTETEYQALINEGNLAGGIDHQNVIKVHYFHDGKTHPGLPPYLLMDFAEGGALQQLLKQRQSERKVFSPSELKSVFLQIASGMKRINEKLIHRDFHLGNVLLQNNIVKITDFGLSKVVDAVTRTRTFKGIQHLWYMPPEVWQSQKQSIQLDMYSVGIAFFELATLEYPYILPGKKDKIAELQEAHVYGKIKDVKSLNGALPDTFVDVIYRLLKKRPGDRFATWDEVIKAIETESAIAIQEVDISSLLAKARATDQQKENQRIEAERASAELENASSRLKFAVSGLKDEIDSLIKAVNSGTTTAKLEVKASSDGFGFQINSHATGARLIARFFIPENVVRREQDILGRGYREIPEPLKCQGKTVYGWGFLEVEDGRGINLILTVDREDDQYGSWKVLRHSPHALFPSNITVHPFALRFWEEFSRQVQAMGAMSPIVTEMRGFAKAEIRFLLEEIL